MKTLMLCLAMCLTGCASITGPTQRWDVAQRRCVDLPASDTEKVIKRVGVVILTSATMFHVYNAAMIRNERAFNYGQYGAGLGAMTFAFGNRSFHVRTWDNKCKAEELASEIFSQGESK